MTKQNEKQGKWTGMDCLPCMCETMLDPQHLKNQIKTKQKKPRKALRIA
jgi:hypothetical protein